MKFAVNIRGCRNFLSSALNGPKRHSFGKFQIQPNRNLSTVAAPMQTYQAMGENKLEYITGLKGRLNESWAAGLTQFFTGAKNTVPKDEVMFVLDEAVKVLSKEPNVVEININEHGDTDESMTVVGDTHGQYYDLMNLLSQNGDPSSTNKYIFNGDFVDRGSFSFQVVFLLLSYKILLPNDVFLTRGNHETVDMNVMYGFFHEIMTKYDQEVMHKFWKVFSHLPLACVLRNGYFPDFASIVLHGGLFETPNVTLEDINRVDRTTALEISDNTRESKIMHDILWSDPMPRDGREINTARGGGLMFGPDVTRQFLEQNQLDLLIRSHQVRRKGWTQEHDGRCITVFSAPNYCDSTGNKAAYLRFSKEKPQPDIYEFEAVRHPPLGPMAHLEIFRERARM